MERSLIKYEHNEYWVSKRYLTRWGATSYRLYHRNYQHYYYRGFHKTTRYSYPIERETLCLNSKTKSKSRDACNCTIPPEVFKRHLQLCGLNELAKAMA